MNSFFSPLCTRNTLGFTIALPTALVGAIALAGCHHEPARQSRASARAETTGHEVEERSREAEQRADTRVRDNEPMAATTDSSAQTERNRLNDGNPPTAQDQSNDATDLEITRAIREQITADRSMSVRARTATTIVTQNAVVTLRGSVATDAERAAIENVARSANGVTRVDNLLVVSR